MSEIRYDRLHDTHVIIAPERLRRPDGMGEREEKTADSVCPFCEGSEEMTPPEIYAVRRNGSLPNAIGWETRVVPNLYKAVQIEAAHTRHLGMFEYWEGFGAHEIIIDTPRHTVSMEEWSENEIFTWLKTLAQRVGDLSRDHRIAHISLFKNEGAQAGATQRHSHTQLIALPLVPKKEADFYRRCAEHYRSSGQPLLGSITALEEEAQIRMIARNGHFSAFCPFASGFAFEVMISSAQAVGTIDTLSDERIGELSGLLFSVLKRLKRQLGAFPFNLWVSTPPLQSVRGREEYGAVPEEAYGCAIKIVPRIYRLGGFETLSAIPINPVSPERAAALLGEGDHV